MFNFAKIRSFSVLGLFMMVSVASADEKKIPVSETPKPVVSAFKAKFPDATIKNVIEETTDGKVTYEVESLNKAGMSIDCVLKPDGEFVAIEKEIKPSDLPKSVAPAIEAKFPKATITKGEEVTSGKKVTYEAVIKKADGKEATLIFDKDGKFVEEEK